MGIKQSMHSLLEVSAQSLHKYPSMGSSGTRLFLSSHLFPVVDSFYTGVNHPHLFSYCFHGAYCVTIKALIKRWLAGHSYLL